MITEWILGLAVTVQVWFAELFPDWTPPEFLTQLDDKVNAILENLTGVGVWADWQYLLLVVTFVVLLWGTTFIIKIARAVASHIPLFGGAG